MNRIDEIKRRLSLLEKEEATEIVCEVLTNIMTHLKYRVVDILTGEDITHKYDWVLLPNGEVKFLDGNSLTGYSTAYPVLLKEDSH